MIGVATVVGAASAEKSNQTAKKGQRQAAKQFDEQAAMEKDRMAKEMELANASLSQQQAALGQQWAALSAQKDAAAKAQALAERNARDADIANNKATRKAPNIGAMLTGNDKAGALGAGSTLLTGAGGAAPGTLGKTTALGA
ncbi:MAG TPA: hypothetical protein DEF32_01570 [Hydrogenophaga sp.]|nr:hypothetical protein [Hydrogenophaga sp.]